jgi:hypothetical protein
MAEVRVTTFQRDKNETTQTFIWIDLFLGCLDLPDFTWTWTPNNGWLATPWRPRADISREGILL